MKVERINASLRYSQDTGHGAWKIIELGAEATVSDREHWKQSQSELYYQLAGQLQTLWSNGSNNGAALNGQNGVENHVEPPTASEPTESTRPHWCYPHDLEWKRRTKNGVIWHSHKAPDGSWCSEPEPAERRWKIGRELVPGIAKALYREGSRKTTPERA